MDNKLWSSRPNSDKGLHATYWAPNEPNLTPLVERSVQMHWNGISGTGKGEIFSAVFYVMLLVRLFGLYSVTESYHMNHILLSG